MLDCIREKLLPLSGASTGVSDQAGCSSKNDNWGIAGKSQMIKDQEAHVIPNVNAIRCRVYTDVCTCRLLPASLSDLWQHPSHGLVIGKSRVGDIVQKLPLLQELEGLPAIGLKECLLHYDEL